MLGPSLSRDDRRVVGQGSNPADRNVDVWLFDLSRRAFTRLTMNVADDVMPVWSHDDERIVFTSNRSGTHGLYLKRASADAPEEELLVGGDQERVATDWSRDGRFVLFDGRDFARLPDIWALPMDGSRKPFPVVQTDFDETRAQFSPDGNWIAYQSDESGRREIYLQRFPGPGDRRLVSTGGGTQVRWNPDGTELFYVAPDGRLMSVRVTLTPEGKEPSLEPPVALFATPLGGAVQLGDYRSQYVVASDGKRFLIASLGEPVALPITVILNWRPRP